MNLDELQSIWNNEITDGVNIPETVKQLKTAQHPLDKLKRNMKNEWFMQLIAIIALAFVPQLQNIHPSLYGYYYIAYGFLIVISVYYLGRFRSFYTHIIHYSDDTKDSLTEIYNEFKINIKRYHSFGFLLLPYGLVWMGVYIQNSLLQQSKDFFSLPYNTKMKLIVTIIFIVLLLITAILGWTKYYYNKYLKQLKDVLDELETS